MRTENKVKSILFASADRAGVVHSEPLSYALFMEPMLAVHEGDLFSIMEVFLANVASFF